MKPPSLTNLVIFLLPALTHFAIGLDLSQCIGPLGMETGAIKDSDISASSSFEDSTVGPRNARIRLDQNGGAWCPKNMIGKEGKEWLEIDLGSMYAISATETQGRFGNGQGVEFSEAYMLEYFRPRLAKWVRYRTREGQEVQDANTNTYVAVKKELNPVILASKIRFHPYSHFKRTICMRVEVYGCSWDDGLLTYSMPQGDRRGNAYEFYDWTYDGEWKGNTLLNGLGCLTDGDYGPENFKLSYYAQGRGWVGWKQNAERDMIEISFEFDAVREFHHIHLYTNNQFSRDVAVFKEARIFFSVGGDIFSPEPVYHIPMEDTIFEEPRNVSAKLHRRVAKFIKVQLYFASKWIMISEVSFESTLARGNYSAEIDLVGASSVADMEKSQGAAATAAGAASEAANSNKKEDRHQEVTRDQMDDNSPSSSSSSNSDSSDDSAFMPIVIGVLTVVILLLAAIIFFIVRHTRQKKWLSVQMNEGGEGGGVSGDILPGEKMPLNGVVDGSCGVLAGETSYPFHFTGGKQGFMVATASSDTGSSGRSSQPHLMPKLDDNYNTPHHQMLMLTPRPTRTSHPATPPKFYSVSRNGSVHSYVAAVATPKGTRKNFPPLPRLQVPPPPPPLPVEEGEEAVYTEPGPPYSEPYRAMRYSPYYGYGPVLSEIEDSLMKQSLLSDTSCGDYAVPLPRSSQEQQQQHHHHHQASPVRTANTATSPISPSIMKKRKKQQRGRNVDSISSLEQHSGYNSSPMEGAGAAAAATPLASCKKEKHSSSSSSSSSSTPQSDSLRAMRARLESHVVPEVTGSQLSLRQRLSEGAFGTVYIADAHGLPDYGGGGGGGEGDDEEPSNNKRLVAVKFLSETASEQERADFIREVRLLSVLEDANISRVLGMSPKQDPCLVAMEYLEHGDLNQFLRCHLPEGTSPLPPGTRTLSFGTLIHMAGQVASGMRYLESLNFVHRDLATRNCLVGKAYTIKICDFGSDNPVYERDYYEMENHLLIPIRWMAWESVLMCKYTTKSDVWSFGVCLWEILQLASVRPFFSSADDGQVLSELQLMQSAGRMNIFLERPPMCPKDLYELMCECWKREAAVRPTFREIHLFLQRKNLGYSPS